MSERRPPVLGLAGGVAAGKSTVAEMFRELGAGTVDADLIGHETLGDDEVKAAIRRRWGAEAFTPEGEVDRMRVAKLVFGDDQARRFLNDLVHPRIRRRMRREMDELARQGAPLIVLDAALLFEGGLETWCDAVAFVQAPPDARQSRALQDRGWTATEHTLREGAQMDPEEKRRRCTVSIDNSGPPDKTRRQVREVFLRMVAQT